MRSIEGKMRGHRENGKFIGNIKPEYAVCAICKDKIVPGLRIRAMIEYDKQEDIPRIYIVHPACEKLYLGQGPECWDHRDDEGAISDSVVRKFWTDLAQRKGWGEYIDMALPLC